jgi:phosphate transport system substrate-binding protein
VPVYNLKGVNAGEITLTGQQIADIYLGKIKKWNDQAIAANNKGVKLPDQAISVVHRSDGSGTTFIFSNYLSKVSPDWKSGVGEGTALKWPTGVGGKGNEGVANYVGRIDGAIGYVESAYAKQNKLAFAKMVNHDGKVVSPTQDSVKAAAAGADWKGAPGMYGSRSRMAPAKESSSRFAKLLIPKRGGASRLFCFDRIGGREVTWKS